jgi:hypothetical protein
VQCVVQPDLPHLGQPTLLLVTVSEDDAEFLTLTV